MSLNTYISSEAGRRTLDLDDVEKLKRLGFSLQWLLLNGEVAPEPAQPRLDAELMARIMDAIAMAYREENQRIPPAEQGRLASRFYDDLVLVDDEKERRAVLAFLVKRHRQTLREAARDPAKTKRQGSD